MIEFIIIGYFISQFCLCAAVAFLAMSMRNMLNVQKETLKKINTQISQTNSAKVPAREIRLK